MSPLRSVLWHSRRRGIAVGVVAGVKLAIRHLVARCVALNIAITEWVAARQVLPRQVVIYNPFDLSQFGVREQVDPSSDFLFVGRLVSEKGVDVLLRAFLLVVQGARGYEPTLSIVGDGPERLELQDLARQLGLEGRVRFVGALTGHALQRAIAGTRVGVVPSSWEEAMGGVALEMLAAGKPVIASRRGGLAEVVGKAGLLFANGDAVDLARQLEFAISDDGWRASAAEESRRQAERFDDRMLAAEYAEAFRWVLWCRGARERATASR
jgi:glycosyltransferase involved in cell wall biosynthesis